MTGPTFADVVRVRSHVWCRRCEKEVDAVFTQQNIHKMGVDLVAECHKERFATFLPFKSIQDEIMYACGAYRVEVFKKKGEGL